MRILIAPDKFKGVMSAADAAEAIATGLREVLASAELELVPIADGGEGTAEVISRAREAERRRAPAHDPLGRAIDGAYAFDRKAQLAVVEMSEVAGMKRVSPNERAIGLAMTFGVGELLRAAEAEGARQIVVGLGGSATNDGGMGMARALGFRFMSDGAEIRDSVFELQKLTRIEQPAGWQLGWSGQPQVRPRIVAAADVRNPLVGPAGAAHTFGAQKGASAKEIAQLDAALAQLADIAAEELGVDYRDYPGAGAAGGLGFGLMTFCGAELRHGFHVVAEALQLPAKVRAADFVVTGEGSLDRQTLEGKAPAALARLASRWHKPVFAIVGRVAQDEEVRQLFDRIYAAADPEQSDEHNIAQAPELLRRAGRELGKYLSRLS